MRTRIKNKRMKRQLYEWHVAMLRLYGVGALNLPYGEAAKIQDDFGEWIVKKLKQEI